MGVGQSRPMGILCQRRFALEYLEPGQALRRYRQAGCAAGAKRQPVEQNAGSRYAVLGKQVLTGGAGYRRLGGDGAFIENRGHGNPLKSDAGAVELKSFSRKILRFQHADWS